MAMTKYIVASLNDREDYDSAYPIDIVYVDSVTKLTNLFYMYRDLYNYPQIYREGISGEFTYQTHTAWHKGET